MPHWHFHGWVKIIPSLPSGEVLYRHACTKFGKLILRRIIDIVANRCHILKPKCTTFDFSWGSAPDPLTEFKGAYF